MNTKRLIGIACLVVLTAKPVLHGQYEGLQEKERSFLLSIPSETQRVDTLNEWAYRHPNKQCRQYAEVALQVAERIGYLRGKGDSHVRLGWIIGVMGNTGESQRNLQQAAIIRESLKDTLGLVSCLYYLGNIQKDSGHYEVADIYYQKALEWMRGRPPHIYTAYLFNSLGRLNRSLGRYEEASKNYRACIDVYEKLKPLTRNENDRREIIRGQATVRLNLSAFLQDNLYQLDTARDLLLKCLVDFQFLKDTVNTGSTLANLGNNAYYDGNLKEAINYYEAGLNLGSIDSTDYNLLLKNRGRVFLDQRQYKKALLDFRTSLKGFEKLGNSREIAANRFEIGNYYHELARLDSAAAYYRLALSNAPDDPRLKGRILYFLSDVLYHLDRKDDANQYTAQYVRLLDGLNAQQTKGAFEELTLYEINKNRVRMQLVRQEKQMQKTVGLIALVVTGLLGLLALFAARLQRQKRQLAERDAEIARQREETARNAAEIARKNEQLAIREKLDMLKNKEVETSYARLEAQDELQQKIGQELHDGVGVMLSAVKLRLAPVDEVLDVLPGNSRKEYIEANRLLVEACEELRRISYQLSSATLLQFGLKNQLEAFVENIPLKVELATHGLQDHRLDFKSELNIYRMVQELVQNIIKHAQAKNVTIQVNRFDNMINVMVEDDGLGFDVKKVRQKPGFGLQSLAARVHDLKGEMQIDSQPGRGTTVSIDLPLKKKKR